MTERAIDTNLLVALIDEKDKWHPTAVKLKDAMLSSSASLVYCDCVINEAIGVIGRRTEEQKRQNQFSKLQSGLTLSVTEESITWISYHVERLFPHIMNQCLSTEGRLNFNDALIGLFCQETGIQFIASFDQDFDQMVWLKRIASAEQFQSLVN